ERIREAEQRLGDQEIDERARPQPRSGGGRTSTVWLGLLGTRLGTRGGCCGGHIRSRGACLGASGPFTLSAAGERGWVDLACSAVAHAPSRALNDDKRHRGQRARALPQAIRENVIEQHGTETMMPLPVEGSQATSSASVRD